MSLVAIGGEIVFKWLGGEAAGEVLHNFMYFLRFLCDSFYSVVFILIIYFLSNPRSSLIFSSQVFDVINSRGAS